MATRQDEAVGVPEWDMQDRLRKSLRAAAVSVQAMADHLDVSRVTVGNYLAGRTSPSTATLRVWSTRCGVPFQWLAFGTEPEDIDPGGQRITSSACVTAASNVVALPRSARPLALVA